MPYLHTKAISCSWSQILSHPATSYSIPIHMTDFVSSTVGYQITWPISTSRYHRAAVFSQSRQSNMGLFSRSYSFLVFWLSLFILTNPRGSDLISVPCKKHHFQLVSFISSPIFAAKSSPPFYTSSCLWKHPQSHHGLMGDETTTLGPSNGGCFIWGMGFGITVIEKTPRKGDWNRCRCPRSCWKKPSGEHGKLKNPTQLGFSIYQHHRTRLVGGWTLPLWKMMEFVSWEIDSQYMEK